MKQIELSLFILLFSIVGCVAQRTTVEEERRNASCVDFIQQRINSYSDQLNFWREELPLPEFIFNIRLDRTFPVPDCLTDRKYFSYRKFIIGNVVNEDVLEAIVTNPDVRLDSLFEPEKPKDYSGSGEYYSKYSYATHSMRYLAEVQLKKVRETKRNIAERISNVQQK